LRFELLHLLLPFAAIALLIFFLPLGFGNAYISRLVRSFRPGANTRDGFIVQLSLEPRLRSGLGGSFEDADDIGYLSLTESELVFEGDCIKLAVPYDRIQAVQARNIGYRGLFIYGQRIALLVSGLGQVERLEFAERSSWILPTSRRIMRQMQEQLAARVSRRNEPSPAKVSH
jgi:hypothetical protein